MWTRALPWMVLLAACAPDLQSADPADAVGWSVDLQAALPGVAPLTLSMTQPLVGGEVTVSVEGAAVGNLIKVLRGNAEGAGPCPPPLGGACLGISSAQPFADLMAAADGTADLAFTMPSVPSLAGLPLCLQAAERQPPGSEWILSDPVCIEIDLDTDGDGVGDADDPCPTDPADICALPLEGDVIEDWVAFDFAHDGYRDGCAGGDKYVMSTEYASAPYVGVTSCADSEYKIWLSDLLYGTFHALGDWAGSGEDHCEFVGGSYVSFPQGSSSTDDGEICWGRGFEGAEPVLGDPCPGAHWVPWSYDCGVTIPDCVDDDADGVCDSVDACLGFDDAIDGDGDGQPDACDACPIDNPDDTDGDGVCDSADSCPLDNPDDTDGDGLCDTDDPCPLDNPDDTDGDGACDSNDPCPSDATDSCGAPLDGDVISTWAPLDFVDDGYRDGCAGGEKYVKSTEYASAPYVGVTVCSDSEYKIWLSDHLHGTYYALGDWAGSGEDHCEFVDGVYVSFPQGSSSTDSDEACWGRGFEGAEPAFSDPCPGAHWVPWSYDCGVTIPDCVDDDADGVCDSVDACLGFDDAIDGDGDGQPDACDACPIDNPDDTDGDGVCDSADSCPLDNPDDTDGDGLCDTDDACPLDNPDDTDGDGACDSNDPCPSDATDSCGAPLDGDVISTWAPLDFVDDGYRDGCTGGDKLVMSTTYASAPYVGVTLCSDSEYKIWLSDHLYGTYYALGDWAGSGEDHCEFVGGSYVSFPQGSSSTDDGEICWGRGFEGAEPVLGDPCPGAHWVPWSYDCGVSISSGP